MIPPEPNVAKKTPSSGMTSQHIDQDSDGFPGLSGPPDNHQQHEYISRTDVRHEMNLPPKSCLPDCRRTDLYATARFMSGSNSTLQENSPSSSFELLSTVYNPKTRDGDLCHLASDTMTPSTIAGSPRDGPSIKFDNISTDFGSTAAPAAMRIYCTRQAENHREEIQRRATSRHGFPTDECDSHCKATGNSGLGVSNSDSMLTEDADSPQELYLTRSQTAQAGIFRGFCTTEPLAGHEISSRQQEMICLFNGNEETPISSELSYDDKESPMIRKCISAPGTRTPLNSLDLRRDCCDQNLFVFHLPSEWGDEDVKSAFSPFGSIVSTKVVKRPDGSSKGYGFVCYEDRDSAIRALDKMNGYVIGGKRLKVSMKKTPEECLKLQVQKLMKMSEQNCMYDRDRDCSLFVFHLPPDWGDADLREPFLAFGSVVAAKVSRKDDGTSRGYGFVTCADPKSAALAIMNLNGVQVANKRLKVQPKQLGTHNHPKPDCTVFVFHLPNDWTDNVLKQIFGRSGNVVAATVQRDVRGRSRGFGFVTFDKSQSARDAVVDLNGLSVGSKRLKVSLKRSTTIGSSSAVSVHRDQEIGIDGDDFSGVDFYTQYDGYVEDRAGCEKTGEESSLSSGIYHQQSGSLLPSATGAGSFVDSRVHSFDRPLNIGGMEHSMNRSLFGPSCTSLDRSVCAPSKKATDFEEPLLQCPYVDKIGTNSIGIASHSLLPSLLLPNPSINKPLTSSSSSIGGYPVTSNGGLTSPHRTYPPISSLINLQRFGPHNEQITANLSPPHRHPPPSGRGGSATIDANNGNPGKLDRRDNGGNTVSPGHLYNLSSTSTPNGGGLPLVYDNSAATIRLLQQSLLNQSAAAILSGANIVPQHLQAALAAAIVQQAGTGHAPSLATLANVTSSQGRASTPMAYGPAMAPPATRSPTYQNLTATRGGNTGCPQPSWTPSHIPYATTHPSLAALPSAAPLSRNSAIGTAAVSPGDNDRLGRNRVTLSATSPDAAVLSRHRLPASG